MFENIREELGPQKLKKIKKLLPKEVWFLIGILVMLALVHLVMMCITLFYLVTARQHRVEEPILIQLNSKTYQLKIEPIEKGAETCKEE